jgi:phosphoserine phosphatase RsbU/P
VDFVQKPWDNTRLLATVDRCLAEARSSRNELEIARNVQQKLLPDRVLDMPGLRAEARFEPAQEIGGDYYDFFPLPNGELGFVLADVSGKGVPAALLMANLQALFRAQDPALLTRPAALLDRINRLFHDSTETARFATVFYGVVSGRDLRWANCGHPSAMVRRQGAVVAECQPTATVLGMFAKLAIEESTVALTPGDSVYVCSDGVIEQDIAEDDRTEIEVFLL